MPSFSPFLPLLFLPIYPLPAHAAPLVADCHYVVAHLPGPNWNPYAYFPSGPSTTTQSVLSAPFLPRTNLIHKTCLIEIHYSIATPDYPLFTKAVVMQFWREAKAVAAQIANESERQQVEMFVSSAQHVPGLQQSRFTVTVSEAPEEGASGVPLCLGAMHAMQVQLEVEWGAPMRNVFAIGCYTV